YHRQAATVFTVSVLCPLHSVHLKLPEDNCCCSAPINTTGRQLILLAAVSVYIYIPALCNYISLQAISMSGRPTRRGRQSQANKRGQAGSVSRGNSAGRGDGASSSARGSGTCLSFFSAAGHVEPQHTEDLVEWMTRPSSSSSSSLTQAQGTLSGKAAANAASYLGTMASVTPSLAPPCPPEEFPELFDHSVGYMLQEDASVLKAPMMVPS
ncbi:hypothetical protein AB205_0160220, partial [Aquarana catesbeiana]